MFEDVLNNKKLHFPVRLTKNLLLKKELVMHMIVSVI